MSRQWGRVRKKEATFIGLHSWSIFLFNKGLSSLCIKTLYWIDFTSVISMCLIYLNHYILVLNILSIRSLLVGSNNLCQIHHIAQQAMWVTHKGLHYTIWTNLQTIPIPKQGRRSQQYVVEILSNCWWIMQTKSLSQSCFRMLSNISNSCSGKDLLEHHKWRHRLPAFTPFFHTI